MNKEILSVIESISNKKSISKEKIFNIIEDALKLAIKKEYNKDINIFLYFDKKLGIYKFYRLINNIKNDFDKNDIFSLDNQNKEEILNLKFNRITTQIVKQFVFKKINQIEKIELINKFNKLIGKIFTCVIEEINNNKIILKLENDIEAIMYIENKLPNDSLKIKNKIMVVLYSVKSNNNNIRLLVTRNGTEIIKELFNIKIPEIYNNLIEIKCISRIPGIKTKVALKTNDINIDPIGSCIGINGTRIKSISNELNGECIDLVLWDSNIFKFIINIFYPIKIISLYFNDNNKKINLLFHKNDLIKVIGKNGINIKLISNLIKYELNIKSYSNL